MNKWGEVRDEFFAWLRTFPLQTNIGKPGDSPEVIGPTDAPVYLDVAFWSERTHEAEARARTHLTDAEIDRIIDEVAAVIDEDLLRFDPLVAYYGRGVVPLVRAFPRDWSGIRALELVSRPVRKN